MTMKLNSSVRKVILIALGVVNVILGLYCIFHPAITAGALMWIAILGMLLSALCSVGAWVEKRNLGYATVWELAGAVLSVIFAIVMIVGAVRGGTAEVLLLVISIWLLAGGVMAVMNALRMLEFKKYFEEDLIGRSWGAVLIGGILMILAGILSIAHPVLLSFSIGLLAGLGFFTAGISGIIAGLVSYGAV